jgi:hypothetical protein
MNIFAIVAGQRQVRMVRCEGLLKMRKEGGYIWHRFWCSYSEGKLRIYHEEPSELPRIAEGNLHETPARSNSVQEQPVETLDVRAVRPWDGQGRIRQYNFGLRFLLDGDDETTRVVLARASDQAEQQKWLDLGKILLSRVARAAFVHILTAPKKWEKAQLRIIGKKSAIFTEPEMKQLITELPLGLRDKSWRRIYCLDDGASCSQLYKGISNWESTCEGLVVVLRDNKDAVFGGAVLGRTGIMPSPYFTGNGQSFVFRHSEDGKTQFFPWTGTNDYVALFSRGEVGMGGDGFAFMLEGDLCEGTSGPSSTFNSPMLASSGVFQCVELEVFGLFLGIHSEQDLAPSKS